MVEGTPPRDGFAENQCINCGTTLEPQAQFCPNCGTRRMSSPAPSLLPSILGPRNLGDLIVQTFRHYQRGFLPIIVIVAVIYLPLGLLNEWVGSVAQDRMIESFGPVDESGFFRDLGPNDEVEPQVMLGVFRQLFWHGALLLLATWIGSVLMSGALIHAISRRMIGIPVTVGSAFSFALARLPAMLGATVIAWVAVVLVALTIIGIPLAIYLFIRWYFSLQAASLERCSPFQALGRSGQLVNNSWWRIFGIVLLVIVGVTVASLILGSVLGLIPIVGTIIVSVLLGPIVPILSILLYHDIRLRVEGENRYTLEVLVNELGPVQDIL